MRRTPRPGSSSRKLNAAGLKAPSEDAVVRLFGVDGGGYAKNPDSALLESQYAWQLGTAGPASRPVILDPDFAKAAAIFVSVYAPDKLAEFQKFVDGLKTQETQCVSSVAAFLIGFVPSSQFGGGSTLLYVLIIGGGLLVIGLLIPFLFLWRRKPAWKNAVPAPAGDEE